jgi:hypothetical protein
MPVETDYHRKAGDTWPPIRARLQTTDGTPIDLTTAVGVWLKMKSSQRGARAVTRAATVEDGTQGVVSCPLIEADTAIVGDLQAEWLVQFPSGRMTVPCNSTFKITILPSL